MTTTAHDFRALGILYLALLLGPLFMLMIILTVDNNEMDGIELFRTIGPVISVLTMALSFVIYNSRKVQGQQIMDVDEKFLHFRTSIILRSALLEGGNLLLIMFMFLDSSDWIYLIFFAVSMGVFILVKPTPSTFITDYKLKDRDAQAIQDLNSDL